MEAKFTGLIAAPFTPMLPDGRLNPEAVAPYARLLSEQGVVGAFVCGTTGEGLSLSPAERQQVAERWVAAASAPFKVIVHVGHNSIGESRALAAHAQRIGAHGFATIGPTFFRPDRAEQLVEFCAQVAAGAPDLPFYYYYLPAMTGVRVPMLEFLRGASQRIPNFAGLKFTDEDLMSCAQCLSFENGRFNILFGRDEILLAALAMGVRGAVGSTYNFMAPIYGRVVDAFQGGDLETARRHQMTAIRIIEVMIRHGGLSAGKAMMAMVGLDCGPVRPPLRNLAPAELDAFRRDLDRVGFPAQIMVASQAAERVA